MPVGKVALTVAVVVDPSRYIVEPAENDEPDIYFKIKVGTSEPISLIVAITWALVVPAPIVALESLIIPFSNPEATAPVDNF